MRILIVNRALGTLFGGGESFDYSAACHLAAAGHDVTLITGKPLFSEAARHYKTVRVVYVPSPNMRLYAYKTEKISSKLSAALYHFDNAVFERAVLAWYAKQPKGSFDIVQCCSLFGLPEQLIRRFNQPVVSWLPGPPSGRVRRVLPGLVTQPNFGLFTHGATEWALQELGFVRGREFDIIEPGISLAQIDALLSSRVCPRERLGLTNDTLLGVTTARLVPVKNHQLLLKAIAQAKRQGVLWHWLVIGDGPMAGQLKSSARQLGIGDHVHFLGYQSQGDVHEWLSTSNLFALTSEYESFSIATLEAMAHRLPVICTDVGYLPHLVGKANAGIVVSLKEPGQMAKALIAMADAGTRESFGKEGRSFVEPLDWPCVATRLEKFYQHVISRGLR